MLDVVMSKRLLGVFMFSVIKEDLRRDSSIKGKKHYMKCHPHTLIFVDYIQ